RRRDLEGLSAGVDLVVAAVEETALHVDEGVAGEDTPSHRLADALLDRRDELLGDDAANDVILEDEAGAALRGFDFHEHVTVLAAAARLLRVFVLSFLLLGDRLAVRDLGLSDVRLDFELALQAVDDDLEVELAHPADDRLARLLVGVHAERRVFL